MTAGLETKDDLLVDKLEKHKTAEPRKLVSVEEYKQMRLNTLKRITHTDMQIPKNLSTTEISNVSKLSKTIEGQK